MVLVPSPGGPTGQLAETPRLGMHQILKAACDSPQACSRALPEHRPDLEVTGEACMEGERGTGGGDDTGRNFPG